MSVRTKIALWQIEGINIRDVATVEETSSSYITGIVGGSVPCSTTIILADTGVTTRAIPLTQTIAGVENYAWFVNPTDDDIVLTFSISSSHPAVVFWAASGSNMSFTVKAGEAIEFGWIRDDTAKIFFTERNHLTAGGV